MTTARAVEPMIDTTDYTFGELDAKYEGEWLAVIITEKDRIGGPTRGRIVYRSKDQKKVLHYLLETSDRSVMLHRAHPRPEGVEYFLSVWETNDDSTG